jgi:hypothetical protein
MSINCEVDPACVPPVCNKTYWLYNISRSCCCAQGQVTFQLISDGRPCYDQITYPCWDLLGSCNNGFPGSCSGNVFSNVKFLNNATIVIYDSGHNQVASLGTNCSGVASITLPTCHKIYSYEVNCSCYNPCSGYFYNDPSIITIDLAKASGQTPWVTDQADGGTWTFGDITAQFTADSGSICNNPPQCYAIICGLTADGAARRSWCLDCPKCLASVTFTWNEFFISFPLAAGTGTSNVFSSPGCGDPTCTSALFTGPTGVVPNNCSSLGHQQSNTNSGIICTSQTLIEVAAHPRAICCGQGGTFFQWNYSFSCPSGQIDTRCVTCTGCFVQTSGNLRLTSPYGTITLFQSGSSAWQGCQLSTPIIVATGCNPTAFSTGIIPITYTLSCINAGVDSLLTASYPVFCPSGLPYGASGVCGSSVGSGVSDCIRRVIDVNNITCSPLDISTNLIGWGIKQAYPGFSCSIPITITL